MTVWISQCLLLEMSLLAGWIVRFAHLRRKLQCVSAELAGCSRSSHRGGPHPGVGGASRPLSHEGGGTSWLALASYLIVWKRLGLHWGAGAVECVRREDTGLFLMIF